MIRILLAASAALALSACSSLTNPFSPNGASDGGLDTAPPPPIEETAPSCPAEAYQVLLGQQRRELAVESLPRPHRIYGHLDMVTMDYRAERMNIVSDSDGVIIRVFCG